MDKKKIPNDKIADAELISDKELDSVAGSGQTGTGDSGDRDDPNFKSKSSTLNAPSVPSSQISEFKISGQLITADDF